MESLYTKYRPQTFSDVVGQKHVVSTLERAVTQGRTSHAYLFCGPRGTGKTTMARLLAKALLCEQGAGHLPDGSCEQCRLIAAGEHPDVYELDAASRTGVDSVREEIISRVSFAPVRGTHKVYIIDEVHMLTSAAFNALLKTLEEPPAHVVFIMCTTDPQKILETILSRVQRFDFHAIRGDDIAERLVHICEREGFSLEPAAVELIVRHARGGMRDAISELERLSVYAGGNITLEAAQEMLGEVSSQTLSEVSMAIAERNIARLFKEVSSLVDVGRDLLQFVRELAAHLRDVYVVCALGAHEGLVAGSADQLAALTAEAAAFGASDRVAHALSVLGDTSTEMRVAPNQRLVLELAFTKLARPQSDLTLESLADRLSILERQLVSLSVPQVARREKCLEVASAWPAQAAAPVEAPAAPAQAAAPVLAVEPQPQTPAAAQPEPALAPAVQPEPMPAPTQPQPVPAVAVQADPVQQEAPAQQQAQAPAQQQPVVQPQSAPIPASQSEPAQPQASASAPAMDAGELQRRWRRVVDDLLARVPQHGSLLLKSSAVSDDGSLVTVGLPKGSSFAMRMLERADVRTSVEAAAQAAFGARKLMFIENGVAADAPASAPAPAVASALVAAPAPAAAPAVGSEPVATPAPIAPAAPSVAPVPIATPAPAPAPEAPAVAPSQQLSAPATPMPWDAVEPSYEEVPYAEADIAAFVEEAPAPVDPAPVNVAPLNPAPASAVPVTAEPASVEPPAASQPTASAPPAPSAPVSPAPTAPVAAPNLAPAAPAPAPSMEPAAADTSASEFSDDPAFGATAGSFAEAFSELFGGPVSVKVSPPVKPNEQ